MQRASVSKPHATAQLMYSSLGRSLSEFLWVCGNPKVNLSLRLTARAAKVLGEHQERAIVVAGSHTGNWDYVACAIAELRPLAIITKQLSTRILDRKWQQTRATRGIELIYRAGAMRKTREALRRNTAVVMMIDQVPQSKSQSTRAVFLGAEAWVDRAPFIVAFRNRVPVLVTAAYRDEDGAHVLDVLEVLNPPISGLKEWVEQAARASTAQLENFVKEHPSDWLWLHRRWKEVESRKSTNSNELDSLAI